MRTTWLGWMVVMVLCSCAASQAYRPTRKFAPEQLRQDYALFRASLEDAHPSLYWYTPKDSMDYYFSVGQNKLQDSLTESGFRYVLSWVVSKIRCGHTSVRASKAATEYRGAGGGFSFPLLVKAWPDTVVVTGNLNRRDSNITRGVVLKSIEGRPIQAIVDSMFAFLSADGYNTTHKYQTLSNGSTFRTLYGVIFGVRQRMPVEFVDTLGRQRLAVLNWYNSRADTPRVARTAPRLSRKERRQLEKESLRSFRIDTALQTGFMEVNTFTKGSSLRRFFRSSFKALEKKAVPHLVVDLRGNGGGSVVLSNLLTKYLADAPFSIADSLYAIRRGSAYGRYRNSRFFNWLFLRFLTGRKKDGHYHFGLYEGKKFKPKSRYHFNGTTYVLTGGNTFSAASLVAKTLQAQNDVVIVGEETGGGAYGNTAWLIPDVTLPNTGVRFRLPLFRLVIDKGAQEGAGVQPEVPSLPTTEAIRRGQDYKMEKVKELIRAAEKEGSSKQ